MTHSVKATYEAELAARGFVADPAQLRAVEALERCATEWANYKVKRSNALKKLINHPDIPRGVYMYGGVGRGKSFLMDCFFNAVPLKRKTRLHFHEFMREVHRELSDLSIHRLFHLIAGQQGAGPDVDLRHALADAPDGFGGAGGAEGDFHAFQSARQQGFRQRHGVVRLVNDRDADDPLLEKILGVHKCPGMIAAGRAE